MKEKGFTLIELLAVIVILAIISIIAIPIVIDMISNSKVKSEKEAVNLYIDTVNKRIANKNLDVLYNPDICTIQSTGDLLCLKDDEELYVDEEKTNKILEVKMNGKKPTEGTLYFTNGKIITGANILYNGLYYKITNGVVSKGTSEKTDITEEVIANIKTYAGNITGRCDIQNATTMVCGSDTKTIQQAGRKAIEGTIIFNNGEIQSYKNLKIDGKYYHNKKGEKSETDNKQHLCTKVSDSDNSGTITKGDKYACKVNDTDTFNFYILKEPEDGKVNMIMDRNICNDGTVNYTSENNYCRCNWYSTNQNNSYGPTLVIQELYLATKNWNNLDNINIEYIDENNVDSNTLGYVGMTIANGIVTITGKNGATNTTIGTNVTPIKARLPRENEMIGAGCTYGAGSCPVWLIENLTYNNVSNNKYSINNNSEIYQNQIYGYWLLASYPGHNLARGVYYNGAVNHDNTGYGKYGPRPVITVLASDLDS